MKVVLHMRLSAFREAFRRGRSERMATGETNYARLDPTNELEDEARTYTEHGEGLHDGDGERMSDGNHVVIPELEDDGVTEDADLSEILSEISRAVHGLTVIPPSESALAQQTVTLQQLNEFVDLTRQAALLQTLAGLGAGALFGLGVNFATSAVTIDGGLIAFTVLLLA